MTINAFLSFILFIWFRFSQIPLSLDPESGGLDSTDKLGAPGAQFDFVGDSGYLAGGQA